MTERVTGAANVQGPTTSLWPLAAAERESRRETCEPPGSRGRWARRALPTLVFGSWHRPWHCSQAPALSTCPSATCRGPARGTGDPSFTQA